MDEKKVAKDVVSDDAENIATLNPEETEYSAKSREIVSGILLTLESKQDPDGAVSDRFNSVLERMVLAIDEKHIPLDDLADYLTFLSRFAVILSPSNFVEKTLGLIYQIDSLERAELYSEYADKFEAFSKGRGDEIYYLLTMLNESNHSNNSHRRSIDELRIILDKYLSAYDWIEELRKEKAFGVSSRISARIRNLIIERPELVDLTISVFKEGAKRLDGNKLRDFVEIVATYSSRHPFTQEIADGFVDKFLPAYAQDDKELINIAKATNSWGSHEGDFGISGYLCFCKVNLPNPRNYNEALMALKEIPTSDQSRFDQNRLDALSLQSQFPALKDFIHDQRPRAHEVICAMVDYYDDSNHDSKKLIASLESIDRLKSDTYIKQILNLDSYDEYSDNGYPEIVQPLSVIDVLRRLKNNTVAILENPPETGLAVDHSMESYFKEGGANNLDNAITEMNNFLINQIDKREHGFSPKQIEAMAWIERQLFFYLQQVSFESQINLYKSDLFKKIVQFLDLTYNVNDYNASEFEYFYSQTVLNPDNHQSHEYQHIEPNLRPYKAVSDRLIDHVRQLMDKYGKEKHERWSGMLWSGNTIHELQTLTSPREPKTAIGQKLYAESISGKSGD